MVRVDLSYSFGGGSNDHASYFSFEEDNPYVIIAPAGFAPEGRDFSIRVSVDDTVVVREYFSIR